MTGLGTSVLILLKIFKIHKKKPWDKIGQMDESFAASLPTNRKRTLKTLEGRGACFENLTTLADEVASGLQLVPSECGIKEC